MRRRSCAAAASWHRCVSATWPLGGGGRRRRRRETSAERVARSPNRCDGRCKQEQEKKKGVRERKGKEKVFRHSSKGR